jgi:hypothetical protein
MKGFCHTVIVEMHLLCVFDYQFGKSVVWGWLISLLSQPPSPLQYTFQSFSSAQFHVVKIARCEIYGILKSLSLLYIWLEFVAAVKNGSFQPCHPHRGNRKLTPLPPSDVLIHLLLSETIFSPPPPDGRNFLCGGSMDLFWNNPMPYPTPWMSKHCEIFGID